MESKYNFNVSVPEKVCFESFPRVRKSKYGIRIPSVLAHRRYFDLPPHIASEDLNGLLPPIPASPLSEVSAFKKSGVYSPGVVVADNKPIRGLKLVGVDRQRLSGYSDYFEVLVPQGFVVPLQADIFFEAILRDGFNHATQELNSEFIFASIKRKIRLVRAGSVFQKAAEERSLLVRQPKLGIKTMNVGEIYQSAAGKSAMLLGFVSTKYLTFKSTPHQPEGPGQLPVPVELKFASNKLATIWWPCDRWIGGRVLTNELIQEAFDRAILSNTYSYVFRQIVLKTGDTPGFVNRIENIRAEVPDDIILRIKRLASQEINKRCDEADSRIGVYGKDTYSRWYVRRMVRDTKLANMIVFGMKPDANNSIFEKITKLVDRLNSSIEAPAPVPGTITTTSTHVPGNPILVVQSTPLPLKTPSK